MTPVEKSKRSIELILGIASSLSEIINKKDDLEKLTKISYREILDSVEDLKNLGGVPNIIIETKYGNLNMKEFVQSISDPNSLFSKRVLYIPLTEDDILTKLIPHYEREEDK